MHSAQSKAVDEAGKRAFSGPVVSQRADANVTAKHILSCVLRLKEQTLQCSEAEVAFAEQFSHAAQHFADGDTAGCVSSLEHLKQQSPAFFHDDASDIVELRKLCGEHRCDSTLMRAETSAAVLRKQCAQAEEEERREAQQGTAGWGHGSRRGRGSSLVMRAESK